jgi:DNA-binding transcriptional ArsR family regulator
MDHDHDSALGTPKMLNPERVERARASMFDAADAAHLAEQFKLLSDPGRIGILSALTEVDEMSVCDIAAAVEATESATSHQLKHLRVGGLITSRKQGRSVYYRLADDHVQQLLAVTAEHYLDEQGHRA